MEKTRKCRGCEGERKGRGVVEKRGRKLEMFVVEDAVHFRIWDAFARIVTLYDGEDSEQFVMLVYGVILGNVSLTLIVWDVSVIG